jgi:8-oxo-dGTP pyrophosphatase MutT (NUDIX family)
VSRNRRRDAPPAPGGWETLSTRNVVADPWLRLDAEVVRTPSGTVLDPWWILDFPDWVLIVPITTNDELVLIRQWRQGARDFILEIPGGIIDPADIDAQQAAARELLEETGHSAASLQFVGHLWSDAARNTNRCHIILATGCTRVANPTPEPGETIETLLLPLPEARAMLRDGGMESAMHCAALLRGLAAARLL